MALTELAVRNAKGREKPYKMSDAAGLYLLVQVNGSRLWRFDYRFGGKRKTLALGAYPVVTLAAAREKRLEAKRALDAGRDPSAKPDERRVSTFREVAEEYLDRLAHLNAAESTLSKNRWLLFDLSAAICDKPVGEVSPADVLAVLRQIEASGRLESARRVRSAISNVYKIAVSTLRAQSDPTFALRGSTKPPKVTSYAAVTDEREFGRLMQTVHEYDGWPTIRAALIFTALTAARPGETRSAEWSEISGDTWVVPASKTKMRKEHHVPLSRQAIEVLHHVSAFSGGGRLIFPSIRSRETPISENGMNAALRRVGWSKDEHTAHGFRSSFSTILNERGCDPEIIEHALAHSDGSVRGIYNRARYWEPRRQLMQEWADLIDGFRYGKPP